MTPEEEKIVYSGDRGWCMRCDAIWRVDTCFPAPEHPYMGVGASGANHYWDKHWLFGPGEELGWRFTNPPTNWVFY